MAPAAVPELLLKKRKRAAAWEAAASASADAARKKARASRQEIFKRAESYVKEYRAQVGGRRRALSLVRGRKAAEAAIAPAAAQCERAVCLGRDAATEHERTGARCRIGAYEREPLGVSPLSRALGPAPPCAANSPHIASPFLPRPPRRRMRPSA